MLVEACVVEGCTNPRVVYRRREGREVVTLPKCAEHIAADAARNARQRAERVKWACLEEAFWPRGRRVGRLRWKV